MKRNQLLIRQLDKKALTFYDAAKAGIPDTGWIHAIRTLLNISFSQLGKKMGVSAQAIKGIENREQEGTVTLNTLRELGKAMDMKFVYGFYPYDGSFEKLIERKAYDAAKKIVLRTHVTMKLEDQENSNTRIQQAIVELADEIKREMPKYLWD